MLAMLDFSEVSIPAQRVQSLAWQGEYLIDWAGGQVIYRLNGTSERVYSSYGVRFDSVAVSSSGEFVVIYERLGTKGLVIRNGKLLREINRSYYHSGTYEYPVALFALPDGREVIAHCPDEYCKIEIDELISGKHLTQRGNEPEDFFYSRLAVNSAGTLLLSAGWVWHPLDDVVVYDIAQVLETPSLLDTTENFSWKHTSAEISSAAFVSDNLLILTSSPEADDLHDEEPAEGRLTPGKIGVFDVERDEFRSIAPCEETVGTLMPIDVEHVIGFYEHPKLIHLSTGRVVHSWPHLDTGKQNSSIIHHVAKIPPVAFDIRNKRFAVAGEENITVVTLKEEIDNG